MQFIEKNVSYSSGFLTKNEVKVRRSQKKLHKILESISQTLKFQQVV